MKKIFNKVTTSLMLITAILSIILMPFNVIAEEKGELSSENRTIELIENGHESLQAGDSSVKKELSVVDSSQGIYKVTLSTKGKNIVTMHSEAAKLYVAIAFDLSSSMKDQKNIPKFTNAKNGALSFVSSLSENYPGAEFSLNTYEDLNRSDVVTDFTDASSMILFINNLSLRGGSTATALGKGIYDAKTLLLNKKNINESAGLYPDAKYIMLVIGDGAPSGSNGGHDTSKEAKSAKNSGIEIYSIGYEVDSDGENKLKSISSDPKSSHYKKADVNGILNVLQGFVTSIEVSNPGASNAVITDGIGNDFTYVEGSKSSDDIVVSGQNVTINVGDVTETEKTYSFNIKINSNATNGWHNTNNSLEMSGTDIENAMSTTDSAKVYWEESKYNYSIEYYYDGVKDDSKTVSGKDVKGKTISVTDEMISGNQGDYEYIETNPSNKQITISNNSDNIIKVYYQTYKTITLSKKLLNSNDSNKNGKFKFKIKLTKDDNPLNGTYKYVKNSEEKNITFENGVATIELKGSESIKFINIPFNTSYEITEVTTEGFIVSACDYINNKETCSYKNKLTGTLNENKNLKFINDVSYELPETGSSGMLILIIIALMCFIGPIIYKVYNFYKYRRMES